MITKRDFVLRGSCFCEKYRKLFSDETVGYLVATNKKRCFSGSGRLLYNLCMDGCQYVVDDNVQITLPDSLFDVNLIPAGENVFFNLSLSLSLALYLCFYFIIPLSFSLSLSRSLSFCLSLSLFPFHYPFIFLSVSLSLSLSLSSYKNHPGVVYVFVGTESEAIW